MKISQVEEWNSVLSQKWKIWMVLLLGIKEPLVREVGTNTMPREGSVRPFITEKPGHKIWTCRKQTKTLHCPLPLSYGLSGLWFPVFLWPVCFSYLKCKPFLHLQAKCPYTLGNVKVFFFNAGEKTSSHIVSHIWHK